MANRLYLVKNGVPFDVAFTLPDDDVLTWGIIFGEMDGNVWCDATNSWKER